MATGTSIFDTLYRVVGASRVTNENKQVAAGMRAVNNAARSMRAGILGMTTALTGGFISFAALGLAMRKSIRDYAAYTTAMSRVSTTLTSQVGNVREATRMVRDVSDSAAVALGYSTSQSLDNMNTMLETGLSVHGAMRVYRTSMELARVGNMELTNSTQFLTDTMNMFRNEQARGNEETNHFARRMSSQLVVGANMASTSISQLQVAFRYAGGEMAAMGYSSQETMAALAGMSSMGIRAGSAGTRLRQAIAKLINITPQTIREFRELGVQETELEQIMFTADGARRPLQEGMQRLAQVMHRLPNEATRARMFFQLFGLRAMGAGTTLAQMTEGSQRIADIMRAYQTADVAEGRIFDQQVQSRMRSFGMQVEQFTQGLSDLGIAFGEVLFAGLDTGRGFGTMFREMVAGIRIAGDLENMTGDQRRQWEALSETERQQAIQYRELLVNIVNIIKVLGALAKAVLPIISSYPGTTLAVLALSRAFGGIGSVAPMAISGIMGLGRTAATATTPLLATGRAMTFVRGAGVLLGIYLVGEGSRALQNYLTELGGVTGEYNQLRRGVTGTISTMAGQIPIIGTLLSMYVELTAAIIAAYEAYQNWARRDEKTRETATTTAQNRMDSVMSRRVAAGGVTEANQAAIFEQERTREESRSIGRVAALMYAQGNRNAQSIAAALQRQGVNGLAATSYASRIERQQRSQTDQMMMSYARDVAPKQWSFLGIASRVGQFDEATASAVTQLRQFSEALTIAPNSVSPVAASPVETAQDAYVRRTGIIRATAGDVLVNRSSLASAITSSSGSLAGPMVNGPSNIVGPSSSGGSGGGSTVIPTVVLQLDGREIARAMGSVHATHLERSGVSIQPGQRRTMRETGFQERLG